MRTSTIQPAPYGSTPYIPTLRYLFAPVRPRSTVIQAAAMRYLNRCRVICDVITEDEEVIHLLNKQGVIFRRISEVHDDFDVMFTEGTGVLLESERGWLTSSRSKGKVNFVMFGAVGVSLWDGIGVRALPEQTHLIDGYLVKDTRALHGFYTSNELLSYILIGDFEWDEFSAPHFVDSVQSVRAEFGEKLLGLDVRFTRVKDQEIAYVKWIYEVATRLGYKLIIQPHPESVKQVPDEFKAFTNYEIHRHILLRACSHFISYANSSVTPESFLLGTNVGFTPAIAMYPKFKVISWMDDAEEWRRVASKKFGAELLRFSPLIHNEKSLTDFLSRPVNRDKQQQIGRCLFEYPEAENYGAFVFQSIEAALCPKTISSPKNTTSLGIGNLKTFDGTERTLPRLESSPEITSLSAYGIVIVSGFIPEWQSLYEKIPGALEYAIERIERIKSLLKWCEAHQVATLKAYSENIGDTNLDSFTFTYTLESIPENFYQFQHIYYCGYSLDDVMVKGPAGYFGMLQRKTIIYDCIIQSPFFAEPIDHAMNDKPISHRSQAIVLDDIIERQNSFILTNRIQHRRLVDTTNLELSHYTWEPSAEAFQSL